MRQNYTGYSMYAPMDGVSVGYTPDGFVPGNYASDGFPYNFQRPDWGLYGVRPRTVYININ